MMNPFVHSVSLEFVVDGLSHECPWALLQLNGIAASVVAVVVSLFAPVHQEESQLNVIAYRPNDFLRLLAFDRTSC